MRWLLRTPALVLYHLLLVIAPASHGYQEEVTGCCLVSAGPAAGVQPLPPLRLCSCSSSLPFCPEASRRHPPFPGYMRPWEGCGHGQGEVGKALSWNEKNKGSCSGQVIASGESWRGRARARGRRMEMRPWQAEVEIWHQAAEGLPAECSPLPVGPGGSWAWARAWPGLRGRTGGPVTLCLQT